MLTYIKLGILEIERQRSHHAVSYLDQAMVEARRRKLDSQRTSIHLAMLHPLAQMEKWREWDEHLEGAKQAWSAPVFDDECLMDILEEAASYCAKKGQMHRADRSEPFGADFATR